MPNFEAGDVVRVPFPYTDRDTIQHRPALVISDGGVGADRSLVWVLMITSAENRAWPGDVAIGDRASAGLPAPSVVRTAKIATVDTARAARLGSLGPVEFATVRTAVARNLGNPSE